MTDYFYNEDYIWDEDNKPLFDLSIGDSLTIGTFTNIISLGTNSPIGLLQSSSTISIYEDVDIEAKDTAFYSTGGNITFGSFSGSWITAEEGYALYFNGSGNRITIGAWSIVASGIRGGGTNKAAIVSGGYSILDNWGDIADVSDGTGIQLTGPENQIANYGSITGGKNAIDIYGDNNSIVNFGIIDTRSLFDAAIYIRELDFGTNVITNTGQITTGPDLSKYGLAIHTEGNSRDTFENGDGVPLHGYVRGNINLGDDSDRLVNHKFGQIIGNINLGSEGDFVFGEDHLTNDGTITGEIGLGNGNDQLENSSTIEGNVYLGSGDDTVLNSGNIIGQIELGDGEDLLISDANVTGRINGGNGADKIHGGGGNDVISGGAGADFLSGGFGNDTFIFDAPIELAEIDIINDFDTADDIIQLSAAIFKALEVGQLASEAFCLAQRPQDASDRIGYNASTGIVWYDPDGTGINKTIAFAELSGGLSLRAENFFVI